MPKITIDEPDAFISLILPLHVPLASQREFISRRTGGLPPNIPATAAAVNAVQVRHAGRILRLITGCVNGEWHTMDTRKLSWNDI